MIIETLVSFTCSLIQGLFSALQGFSLPMNALIVLLDFFSYSVWIIGIDLMASIISVIVGWLTFKFMAGLILFVWRLLPLT